MISRTCGLTLIETYTTYLNEGKWNNAVKKRHNSIIFRKYMLIYL